MKRLEEILTKATGAVVGACYCWEFHGGGASHVRFGAKELPGKEWRWFRDLTPVQESATNGDCTRAKHYLGTVLVAERQGPGMYQPGDTTYVVFGERVTRSEYEEFRELVWREAHARAQSLGYADAHSIADMPPHR